MIDFLTPTINVASVISWGVMREVNGRPTIVRTSRSPLSAIPEDAPQAVKDLAAQHWTPEVIQAAKDRLKPKVT